MSDFPGGFHNFMPSPRLPNPHRFYADTVYERIRKLVEDHDLAEGERLAIAVLLCDGSRVLASDFGYQNPNFIIVYGVESKTGQTVEAWLSHTSFQLLVSKTTDGKREDSPRLIGFRGNISTNPSDEE